MNPNFAILKSKSPCRAHCALLLSASIWLASSPAQALTTEGFFQICDAGKVPCKAHQLLNAYLGGALDLVATLDEAGVFRRPLYCVSPEEVFDMEEIINFMHAHKDEYADRNAMWPVIRYFQQHGRC